MKVLARLLSQIDIWQCSNLVKCTLIWVRELKEINRLLSQMDILHQMLIKVWSRDTLICERVLQILTLSSNSQYVLTPKIRFDPPGHRKTRVSIKGRKCRVMTCWCENEVSEKSKHSSWTVGHVSRWGNLTPPTIIICKETIVFNNNNNTNNNNNDLGVRLPAYACYGRPPHLGDGLSILSQHPFPDFPPYVVRTPHIHGATDYGAPNSLT